LSSITFLIFQVAEGTQTTEEVDSTFENFNLHCILAVIDSALFASTSKV
jgi:hypothetical protein